MANLRLALAWRLNFVISLNPEDKTYLTNLLHEARDPVPSGWKFWHLQNHPHPLGLLSPERAMFLSSLMPANMPLVYEAASWVWHAAHCTSEQRSQTLQHIAKTLHDQQLLSGWRNEDYACWGCLEEPWPYLPAECFQLERASFRYFGLRSHAAHVHGMTSNGRMWCGRRAMNKATDPGLLDNLAAGGLPAQESPLQCMLREIQEEAGLHASVRDLSLIPRAIVTERQVAEGWHSERLFIYTLALSDSDVPSNQDGEVSEFLCLSWSQVMLHLRAQHFTRDAACAIALSALLGDL